MLVEEIFKFHVDLKNTRVIEPLGLVKTCPKGLLEILYGAVPDGLGVLSGKILFETCIKGRLHSGGRRAN